MNKKKLLRILCLVKKKQDYLSIRSPLGQIRTLELDLVPIATAAELEQQIASGTIDAYILDYEYLQTNIVERVSPTPVITLVAATDCGTIALAKGAADYLETNNLTSRELERSLRLCLAKAAEIAKRIASERQHQRTAAALKESSEIFRSIFTRAAVGIGQIDLTDKFILVNQKLCELTGYSSLELTQLRVKDITHPEDLAGEISLKQEMLAGKIQSFARDKRYIRRDGSCVWVNATVSLVRDNESLAKYIIEVVEDISDRKIAEETLTNSEKRIHSLADSLPVCIAYVDSERRYQFVNQNYYNWFGLEPAEICGRQIVEILGEPAYRQIASYIDRVYCGQRVQYQADIPYKKGDRYVSGILVPDFDEDNRVKGYYSLIIDITPQKLAEEKLRASEALYAGIFNHSAEGIFSLDILPGGEFVFETINPTYEILTGMKAAQVKGKKVERVLPRELSAISERLYRACIKTNKPISYETTLELPSGRRIWRTILVPIHDRAGKITKLQGSARDITVEKQITAKQIRFTRHQRLLASLTLKIRQSWQIDEILQIAVTEIRRTLQAERVLFYRLDKDKSGKGIVVNEDVASGFPAMLGEVISDDCYYQKCQEKYHEGYINVCNDVLSAKFAPCYRELLQKYQIRANLIVAIAIDPKQKELIDLADAADRSTPTEPRIWGLLCVQQCSDSRNWTKEEIELLQQLADRSSIAIYQAELIAQQNHHRQELARSNAELEQFAYVASHDLQEPLRTIASYARLLQRRYQDRLDAKADKYIHHITDSAARMERQINDLLEYSLIGRNDSRFTLIDCHAVFKQAIANLQLTIRRDRPLVMAENLPQIQANYGQILQLFQNLIGNALKYRRGEPPIVLIKAKLQENGWLFSVTDNGIGIDFKYQKRIFQIFQRLHPRNEYPGTGIGLAICQKIVKHHGGEIWVKSEPNIGSTFYFTIARIGK